MHHYQLQNSEVTVEKSVPIFISNDSTMGYLSTKIGLCLVS